MKINAMTEGELAMVLDWAQAEGWNPGLGDAPAFHDADPGGFFLAEIDGAPVAAISVVNHDDAHAFLGLYICRPEYRGQGRGFALWQAALAHAGGRTVTLDGVAEQQANYARSGFVFAGRTLRHSLEAVPPGDGTARPAQAADMAALMQMDRAACGHARDGFARAWFDGTETRRTWVVGPEGAPAAFATHRLCHSGTKIGPLHAQTEAEVRTLLSCAPQGPVFIDVPEGTALETLVRSIEFEPVFQTARMHRGPAPQGTPPAYYAVATLELG